MTDNVGHTREGVVGIGDAGRGPAESGGRVAADVREVPLRELNRRTSDVISGLRDGDRLVVTRYGVPVAVMLSIADAFELIRGATGWQVPRSNLDLRGELRAAMRATVGSELERQTWRRELGRYLHGRWHSR
jgi:prevent-host-death family protein